jgi:2-polyprenyl-3-methyl-5-hydroxy-6-metoxy-1,4-benzoquinol methylase
LYRPDEYFRGSNSVGHGYDDYYALRPAVERTGRRRLNKIRRLLGLGSGHLLDIGCGPGFFLDVARAHGWQVSGVEISTSAAEYARHAVGLPVVTGSIESVALPRGSVDMVTMWDVLEHVPDPAGAFRAAK